MLVFTSPSRFTTVSLTTAGDSAWRNSLTGSIFHTWRLPSESLRAKLSTGGGKNTWGANFFRMAYQRGTLCIAEGVQENL